MLASSTLFILFALRQKQGLHRAGSLLLYVGFGLWTLELLLRYSAFSTLPVYDVWSAIFFWGWCGLLIYLFYHRKFKLSVMGALVVPLCFLLLLISAISNPAKAFLNPHLKGIWFHLHVLTMFLGIAMFLLASVSAGIYLWVDRLLKAKTLMKTRIKLPSLVGIDNVTHYSISLGFFFYSLGMLVGLIYAQVTFGKYWQWDAKEVWALVTWILYGVLLHERLALGWKGKKASVLTLICFLAMLFTFLGVGHLGGGYHTFKAMAGGK